MATEEKHGSIRKDCPTRGRLYVHQCRSDPSLEVSALNADASIVRFDKDNTVTVAQRLDDLFQALSDSKPL